MYMYIYNYTCIYTSMQEIVFHYWLVRLSGYENTLLGYRSRHYRLVKDHPDAMDAIMFGGRSLVKYNITL